VVEVSYSTIRGNTVFGGPAFGGGGGLFGRHDVSVLKTTVSGNFSSGNAAGVGAFSGTNGNANTFSLSASTVSGNIALLNAGGSASDASAVKVYNSTIAFNRSNRGAAHGSAYAPGFALYAPLQSIVVTLSSSILSQNYFGYSPDSTELDFSESPLNGHTITLTGASGNNLIRVGPDPTPGACPLLGPLRDNGGLTQTHALLSHSPAIDTGSNILNFIQDQRGADLGPLPPPYPRVSHGAADIGACEVNQADVLFNAAFDGCAPLS